MSKQTRTTTHKPAPGKTSSGKPASSSPNYLLVGGGALVLILIIAAVVWMNRGAAAPAASAGMPAEISVEQAKQKYDSGIFILDVREQDEWDAGHIPNATLIPLGQLQNRASELPKDKEIVVVCRSGKRSATGRDTLLNAGFASVTSMAGGMVAWQAAGYPTVTGP